MLPREIWEFKAKSNLFATISVSCQNTHNMSAILSSGDNSET